MKIGILGGGFGLYAYLPAAIRNGWEPHTLSRYQQEISLRPELSKYIDEVHFHSDDKTIISSVGALVCARNPESQIKLLENIGPFSGHLYLEKPLAPTIAQHEHILKRLILEQRDFSVGYLFPYTDWYNEILKVCSRHDSRGFNIHWNVKSPDSSWKFAALSGGGIANFYAIHFVTLLDDLDIDLNSLIFLGSENCLNIQCKAKGGVDINITIQLSLFNHFRIQHFCEGGFEQEIVNTETPFGLAGVWGTQDPRVSILAKYMALNFHVDKLHLNLAMEAKILQYRKLSLQAIS